MGRLAALIALYGIFLGVHSHAHAREIIDFTQTRVVVSDYPKRIVTLAPSLGELAADLSNEKLERIVGVSEYTDYPPALTKVTSIGPYTQFSLEKVVSLKPDLVLATKDGNSKDQITHLRELKIPVVVVGTETFREVEESIRLVAHAMGATQLGEKMVSQFTQGVANIRERAKSRIEASGAKPEVLLQIGDEPLVVVGRRSFLHEVIETLGATNVYADADAHYPKPSLEDVIHKKPDVIIVLALGRDLGPFKVMAKRWSQFAVLPAVKNRKIAVFQGDMILRPTLRLLEGLSLLEKGIHESK